MSFSYARSGTRTHTPEGTAPSRRRVYLSTTRALIFSHGRQYRVRMGLLVILGSVATVVGLVQFFKWRDRKKVLG